VGSFSLDISCDRNGVTFIESILSTWQEKMIKMMMISGITKGVMIAEGPGKIPFSSFWSSKLRLMV
jgi:hypothetical protein